MTTTPTGEPLWTEERMIAEAEALAAHWAGQTEALDWYTVSRQILRLLRQQKDTASAQHEQLQRLLGEYQDLYLDAQRQRDALAAELAALRAEPRYVPVEPKTTLHTWDVMGNECMDVIQVLKAFEYADGPRQLLTVSEQFGVHEASVYLPDNVRVCRLVPGQDTQQQSTTQQESNNE